MTMEKFNTEWLKKIVTPRDDAHKGENGRVMVIGGSKLFHASIFWSADIASKVVDLVHFVSPAEENNELVRIKIKEKMWSGIVVPWSEVDEYIKEDDAILIGPGMPREEGLLESEEKTGDIVNKLLRKYPNKRWVVDGGALQEVDSKLFNSKMIITPHEGEYVRVFGEEVKEDINERVRQVKQASRDHEGVVILLKGKEDVVSDGKIAVVVEGGGAGMTKGGTGDVLAGLVVALYAKSERMTSAVVASYLTKRAGDSLKKRVGAYFSAADLVSELPGVMKENLD